MKESLFEISKKPKKQYSLEERKNHLSSWHQSGLSLSEYCRDKELGISTLSKWAQREKALSPKLKLKPLNIQQVSPGLMSGSKPLLEIRLPDGIQIRVTGCADKASLKMLWEVIRSCS